MATTILPVANTANIKTAEFVKLTIPQTVSSNTAYVFDTYNISTGFVPVVVPIIASTGNRAFYYTVGNTTITRSTANLLSTGVQFGPDRSISIGTGNAFAWTTFDKSVSAGPQSVNRDIFYAYAPAISTFNSDSAEYHALLTTNVNGSGKTYTTIAYCNMSNIANTTFNTSITLSSTTSNLTPVAIGGFGNTYIALVRSDTDYLRPPVPSYYAYGGKTFYRSTTGLTGTYSTVTPTGIQANVLLGSINRFENGSGGLWIASPTSVWNPRYQYSNGVISTEGANVSYYYSTDNAATWTSANLALPRFSTKYGPDIFESNPTQNIYTPVEMNAGINPGTIHSDPMWRKSYVFDVTQIGSNIILHGLSGLLAYCNPATPGSMTLVTPFTNEYLQSISLVSGNYTITTQSQIWRSTSLSGPWNFYVPVTPTTASYATYANSRWFGIGSQQIISSNLTPQVIPAETYTFSSAYRYETINGNVYSPLGGFLAITDQQRDIRATGYDTTLSITGLDPTNIYLVLAKNVRGAEIELYRGFYNANLTLDPANVFRRYSGVITSYTITEERNGKDDVYTISLNASNYKTILENSTGGRKTNSVSWKDPYFENTTDTIMDNVTNLVDKYFDFGKGLTGGPT